MTLLEIQQMPEIEKLGCEIENSCLKWTIYKGGRKVCVNYKTERDKLDIVTYCYRKGIYLKNAEMELNLIEYEKLLSKKGKPL